MAIDIDKYSTQIATKIFDKEQKDDGKEPPATQLLGHVDITRIAEHLTTAIFDCCSEDNCPVTRIQFISGQYPNKEQTQGGANRKAFELLITESLIKLKKQHI